MSQGSTKAKIWQNYEDLRLRAFTIEGSEIGKYLTITYFSHSDSELMTFYSFIIQKVNRLQK